MPRPHQVAFRVTRDERLQIRRAARASKERPSEWLRRIIVRETERVLANGGKA